MIEFGWHKVENRRGLFARKDCGATLMVYVDDFKTVCLANDTKKLWAPLREKIRLSEPCPITRYCRERELEAYLTA